jgi:hypothetical protein
MITGSQDEVVGGPHEQGSEDLHEEEADDMIQYTLTFKRFDRDRSLEAGASFVA